MSHEKREWQRYARCAGNPEPIIELFFSHVCNSKCVRTKGKRCDESEYVEEARQYCYDCPVMDRCRWWAVVTNLTDGVAGGLTVAQRRIVRAKLRKDPIGNALLQGRIEFET